MSARSRASLVQLKARQLLHIEDGAGLTVTCCAGSLWITQHADLRDIILKPGERFTLDRAGLALVHAVSDAVVTVSADAAMGCAGLAARPARLAAA